MHSAPPLLIKSRGPKEKLSKWAFNWLWIFLSSCTYSPNYSKVDASNHSVTNYNYSARQMAIGIPNQPKDSMVTTTYEDEENNPPQTNSPHHARYNKPVRLDQPPSPPPGYRKLDTSYIIPNPLVGIFRIFGNAIKNFNDRMEYISPPPYNTGRGYYCYQPTQNSYAAAYQQSLRRHGIYGPRNSMEAQAYAYTQQALNQNRY